MRVELTDAYLRALPPPATGRLEVWDSRVTGLLLRVAPNGTCAWSVRSRTHDGKRTRSGLGNWPAVSLKQARQAAHLALGQIAHGADPVAAKRTARAARIAQAKAPTVAMRLEEWQQARAAAWSPRYGAEVARLCGKIILPALGARPLRDTTRNDWVALVSTTRASSAATGTWVFSIASAFLNFAESSGWVDLPVLPRRGANLLAPHVPARARILSDAELAAVWRGAGTLSIKSRTFVRMMIMTAARELEVADIAVGEVDRNAARWSLASGRTKNSRPLTLPLHPLLLDELSAVWPDGTPGEDYRLLGKIRGNGFRGFSKLKVRLDALSDVTDWRWHDLRRTARSGMGRLGVSSLAAEAALNHVGQRSALERTYDRYDYVAEAIAAVQTWQDHVGRLVGANVVEMRLQVTG